MYFTGRYFYKITNLLNKQRENLYLHSIAHGVGNAFDARIPFISNYSKLHNKSTSADL